MIKIRPYQKGDAYHVKSLKIFSPAEELKAQINSRAQHHKSTFAHTITKDGRPIAILGISFWWPGMAEAWSLISEEMLEYPIFLHKKGKQLLALYQQLMGVVRYQATVRCDFEDGLQWIERLGFKVEGCMRKWGPDGKDYMIYGRVV